MVRSFPGITRDDRMTVSPGPSLTCGCAPVAIRASADSGSPCDPVVSKVTVFGSRAAIFPTSNKASDATIEMASLASDFDIPDKTFPYHPNRTALLLRQFNDLPNAMHMRGKGRHQHFALRVRHDVLNGPSHRTFGGRGPRPIDIGRIGQQQQHALCLLIRPTAPGQTGDCQSGSGRA